MYRRNIHIKTKCGQHTCKVLSNHQSFSPSQSHATVPLRPVTFFWQIPHEHVLLLQQESNKSEQQLGVVTLDLAKTSKVADGILKKVRMGGGVPLS